ncbi:MAG: helix-turn-helix domain-containing protein [Nitrosopumilus sp.]
MIRKNKESLIERYAEIIENDDEKLWQIEFFEDKRLMQVFLSLINSPKSAKQISRETKIPIGSVYRKLKKLEQKELLERSGMISHEGSKTFLYQS